MLTPVIRFCITIPILLCSLLAIAQATTFTQKTCKKTLRSLKEVDVPKEHFVFKIAQAKPDTAKELTAHSSSSFFKNNQPILLKIIADLNERLIPDSVLYHSTFSQFLHKLQQLRETGIDIFKAGIPATDFHLFVVEYIETMNALFSSVDPKLDVTYHRNFTRKLLKFVLAGKRAQNSFFTYKTVDSEYFFHLRPTGHYLHWIVDPPKFIHTKQSYKGGPLVKTVDRAKYLDGLFLDSEEVTKHDVGHSFYMKRQDEWLFNNLNTPRHQLVRHWLQNKDHIQHAIQELHSTNPELVAPTKLLLSEIIHERGYQYFLPILIQQLGSKKWPEILHFKSRNKYWGNKGPNRKHLDNLTRSQEWLFQYIEKLHIEQNNEFIQEVKSETLKINLWHEIETYTGLPISVRAKGINDFNIDFKIATQDVISTSLYEISLVLAPKAKKKILSPEKIKKLEQLLWYTKNSTDKDAFVKIDRDGNSKLVSINLNNSNKVPLSTSIPEEHKLSEIEIYKLERLLNLLKLKQKTSFTVTKLPSTYYGKILKNDTSTGEITFRDQNHNHFRFNSRQISIEKSNLKNNSGLLNLKYKYINLNPKARYVSKAVLRDSYITNYNDSNLPPFVQFKNPKDNDAIYELAIVDTSNIEIATAVSSLLTRSLSDAKISNNGYIPDKIVERVQRELISPYSVNNLWGQYGYRFVLSKIHNETHREIISTALVTKDHRNLLFFTSMFNNLKISDLKHINFDISAPNTPNKKWFDKFVHPPIEKYKPIGYHQFANFVVEKEGQRHKGIARLMINNIVSHYSRKYLMNTSNNLAHSQPLLNGEGLWQIGDPPWLARMSKLGFIPRLGAESFHIDVAWDKLHELLDSNEHIVDHTRYNSLNGLFSIYQPKVDSTYYKIMLKLTQKNKDIPPSPSIHLIDRIDEVLAIARSGKAKLQYYHLVFPFEKAYNKVSRTKDEALK